MSAWSWTSYLGGIGTGVATSILARLAYDFFKAAVPPYVEERLYTQIQMQGNWAIIHEGEPLDGNHLESAWMVEAKIKQSGQKELSGAPLPPARRGPPRENTYPTD